MAKKQFTLMCELCGASFYTCESVQRFCSRGCFGQSRVIPIKNRLLAHIKIDVNGCWNWTGRRSRYGYGQFGKDAVGAHRVSWTELRGPIPEGHFVCHSCDNPPCINPDHLFLGMPKDNTRDMIDKGRSKHPNGQDASTAKLTAENVAEIRKSALSQSEIARKFGITQSNVSRIRSRQSWNHL